MKKEFKTESKKILDLMINSIYTNKDIFLRELISNASDALDKLYYISLTSKDIKVNRKDLKIEISFDEEKRTITIKDNGIGMSKDDLINNLGTIAKSGTSDFKELLDAKDKSMVIGQFGVGFYSSFMVAKEVEVTSKKDNEDSYTWKSNGKDGYEIEKSTKKDRGTIITLHLKDNDSEFAYDKYLNEYEIKNLVKKYSDYIEFPIEMLVTHHTLKDEEKHEYEDHKELEILNSMVPLWKKDKKTTDQAEYDNFYMNKFGDLDKPSVTISSSVEGLISYKSLLFIPSHAPYNYYSDEYKKGLSLYTNGVLIMDKCEDLVPDYFSFVKGVVDCEDLPLNISRETLQSSSSLRTIEKSIESKIRKELENILTNDRTKYEEIFKNFGVGLKYGIYNNYGQDKDKLKDLVMFYSKNNKKLITLKEYVDNMKENQSTIYYAIGQNYDKISTLPQLEKISKLEYDVLYLTDYVDEFAITALQDYDGKKFQNIEKADLDIISEEEKKELEEINTKEKDMLEHMKEVLKDVSDVVFTTRLNDSPVCITTKGDISIEMQKVFAAMPNGSYLKAEMQLEINKNHPISSKLIKLYKEDKELFDKYTKIIYSEARTIAGLPVENPVEITKLIVDIISK